MALSDARCTRVIFTKRWADVCAPHARDTGRLGAVIPLVGHAVGGRGGERLLQRLGMAVSDDTVLRRVKRAAAVARPVDSVRVLGLDDWAWQKGQHHYGTILVDRGRRRVVGVLAVQTADAVAAWLAAHPTITIISRDRYGPYAEGVRRGAPQARQVPDGFHLVVNLRGAVEQELSRLRSCLTVP